jgi:hypothetical protein
MEFKNVFNTKLIYDNFEFYLYSLVCFFVPFLIGHPQLLVGTLVNATLILSAINFRYFKIMPMIFLPSLAVLSRGLIFGPFTIFILYMLPFIWLSNFVLVYFFKNFNFNKWAKLFLGTLLKTLILFISAFVLFKIGFIPAQLLGAFGLFQIYTAILGGILAFNIQNHKKLLRISD